MEEAHGLKWKRLGDGNLPTEDAESGLGHIVSQETYWWTFLSLLTLTAVTIWAAGQEFGPFNLLVAMAIATVKAGVVTLYFMHLRWESKIIWGIVTYPIIIFLLILIGTMGDASVKRSALPSALHEVSEGSKALPSLPTHDDKAHEQAH